MKRLWFLGILFFHLSLAYADDSASHALSERLNHVKTFRGDFIQDVLDDRGQVLLHSTGKMQFNRPALFYWNTLSPHPQTMWYRNNTLIILDAELEQATIKKMDAKNDPTLLPLMLLTGDAEQALKPFLVEYKNQMYYLQPKASDQDNLLVEVSLKLFSNGAVQEIQYQTHLGQHTRVRFEHVEVNKKLDISLFYQPLPRGIDIIYGE